MSFRLALAVTVVLAPLTAQTFYPDDPLWREPPPMNVGKPRHRDLSNVYDSMQQSVYLPGRRPGAASGAVNTLGEVPDSTWYQNRHSLDHRMSVAELVRGPALDTPPTTDQPWIVLSGKAVGATPGLMIEDSLHRRFLLKFDPLANPEITTAADVIGSKFFYALGYSAPQNYIVHFGLKQLRLAPDSKLVDHLGRKRKMEQSDLLRLLKGTRVSNGTWRAMASRIISGDIIGPFQYFGTRSDDPNDVVPHEDRRDLRGLFVFSAWVNHYDATCINTLDTVVEEDGIKFIKHYLIDFGSILGASAVGPRVIRSGNAYFFDLPFAATQLFTLGLDTRPWQVERDPYFPELGEFGFATFDPRRWRPIYPNPAFTDRRPPDNYWAAKKVMAFTDDDIRAIVRTGEYTDRKAEEWLIKSLIARRDKIGKAFLEDVLPLEHFRFEGRTLRFDDLGVRFGLHAARTYRVQWFRFDNASGRSTFLPQGRTFTLPQDLVSLPPESYFGAEIRSDDPRKAITVYFRTMRSGIEVVGINRYY